jgi:hypothetical protein
VHVTHGLALSSGPWPNFYLHMAAAHLRDGSGKLAKVAAAVSQPSEQGDAIARLQAQHLHMARRTIWQVQE